MSSVDMETAAAWFIGAVLASQVLVWLWLRNTGDLE
jgi:hypothetical protein